MAIRIRCDDCGKKISIDEAFAGGMCRCPYCKALVFVKDLAPAMKSAAGVRPSAPSSRPAAPGAAPAPATGSGIRAAAEQRAKADIEHVPMARPVKIQGIITIVLLVLLVLMVAGGITFAVVFLKGGPNIKPPPPEHHRARIETPPPTAESSPKVVDIDVTAPIIYVLDGGSGMRDSIDKARVAVINSVTTLGDGKFNVIVAGEGADKVVESNMVPGGKQAAAKLTTKLQEMYPTGAANLARALKAALDKKPKTIVLLTGKTVDGDKAVIDQAKGQNTVIDTISIGADSDTNASLKAMATATGGQARAFDPQPY